MPDPEAFIDTNVLLYLLSSDVEKAGRAEAVLRNGGRISVQVLNELANVARRKLALSWTEIHEITSLFRLLCPVEPLTLETHEKGMQIAERYGVSVYDGMILSAALLSSCELLYSEDMQDGLVIDRTLTIRNPFLP